MATQKKLRITPRGYLFILGIVLVVVACIILIAANSCAKNKGSSELTPTAIPTASPEAVQTAVPATQEPVITTPDPAASTPAPVTETVTPATSAPAETPLPALGTQPTSKQKDSATSGIITANDVNLRGGPSTKYVSLGKYSKDTEVIVYETKDGFCFVKVVKDGKIGYISKDYVKAVEAGDAPADAVTGKVSASSVALREGPAKDSKAVGELSEGAVVYVYFKTGDFYYIEVASSGVKCYAYAQYIKASASVPSGTPVP